MRSNLQVKVGSFTGNGTDDRSITDVGFKPDFVSVKAEIRNQVFRTNKMARDVSGFISSTNSNLPNYIQDFLTNGFQVGSTTNANENLVKIYYLAMRGAAAQKYLRTGLYLGDGTDNRNFTSADIGFTPDFVLIQQIGGTTSAVFRTSAHNGDLTSLFDASSHTADIVQSLISNGFQLGTSTRANASGGLYAYLVLKNIPGVFQVGVFTGNSLSGRKITGLGFKPDCVFIKSGTTTMARILTSEMVKDGATSKYTGTTATDAVGILTLDDDGFTVGNDLSVNGASTYYWFAFKSGNFNVPVVSRQSA